MLEPGLSECQPRSAWSGLTHCHSAIFLAVPRHNHRAGRSSWGFRLKPLRLRAHAGTRPRGGVGAVRGAEPVRRPRSAPPPPRAQGKRFAVTFLATAFGGDGHGYAVRSQVKRSLCLHHAPCGERQREDQQKPTRHYWACCTTREQASLWPCIKETLLTLLLTFFIASLLLRTLVQKASVWKCDTFVLIGWAASLKDCTVSSPSGFTCLTVLQVKRQRYSSNLSFYINYVLMDGRFDSQKCFLSVTQSYHWNSIHCPPMLTVGTYILRTDIKERAS